jgi:2-keto-4-pentenoate hydratase
MKDSEIDTAVGIFVEARRTGRLIDALPSGTGPETADDAHRIQEATIAALSEQTAGWKTAKSSDGSVLRGAIFRSRTFESPARVPAALCPLLGVEPEIAYRFDTPIAPREAPYSREEVAAVVTAFPAIEIVDSRFAGYPDVPEYHKTADCVSNGGFVYGPPIANWRDVDLINLPVRVTAGDDVLADVVGGHPRADPLLPAVDLVNDLSSGPGIEAGRFVTTGSYCGLLKGRPGVPIACRFGGIGDVELLFTE